MLGLLKRLFRGKKKKKNGEENVKQLKQFSLSRDIQDNIRRLKDMMNNSYDIKSRIFEISGSNTQGAILYIDNLVNENMLQDQILKPLLIESTSILEKTGEGVDFDRIRDSMISVGDVKEAETFDEIVLAVMSGDTFLCIQGYTKGLLISARGYQGRTVGEPAIEPSVKGPQEAFVEILKLNIGLIRRRYRDPNLCIEVYKLGRRTKADTAVLYIKGIAHQNLVDEVKRRLTSIDIDIPSTATQLGHLLVDNPSSIFPLLQTTERPDKVVTALGEGRVALLLEGSPDAIVVPVTLPILMQSVDDYFDNWIAGSVIRISRYVALFISTLFPALYIATTSVHPGMLPTNLALSIAAARAGVPFPTLVEAVLMESTLELLQEAGIRLPRVVGQTVSIVGGLVIGQAAVQAGVVSPIMVIVISITAVASFTIPDYSLSMATRIVRVPFMILSVTFGSFGIAMGMLFLLSYLSDLKSFGIRYLEPITPYRIRDWKDTLIRAPQWTMGKRPEFLSPEDTQRMKPSKRRKLNER